MPRDRAQSLAQAHAGAATARPAHAWRAPANAWFEAIAARLAGVSSPQRSDLRLAQRNVYVLPSRAGMLFGVILVAMLVASINYALSMGFMLTFLLGAVAVVAILHTFRNLSALVLRPGRAEPVFAGQPAEFSVLLVNSGRLDRFAIRILAPGMTQAEVVDVPARAEQLVRVAIPARRRGRMPVPRLRLWTEYPLGLWRVWAYWHPAIDVLVYPAPETPPVPLPQTYAATGEGVGAVRGEEDVAAVRPYRAGDSPRRIAWRAIARIDSDELLTKQFDGGEQGELLLDWASLPSSLDTEARISRLTRWVLDAEASGARWGLRLPREEIGVDAGPGHRQRCLEALALLEV